MCERKCLCNGSFVEFDYKWEQTEILAKRAGCLSGLKCRDKCGTQLFLPTHLQPVILSLVMGGGSHWQLGPAWASQGICQLLMLLSCCCPAPCGHGHHKTRIIPHSALDLVLFYFGLHRCIAIFLYYMLQSPKCLNC